MLRPLFVMSMLTLVIAWGIGSGAFGFVARMLSRIFTSDRRREPPQIRRGGGVAGLAPALTRWVERRRALGAAVADLWQVAPAYHRSFEVEARGLLDDRRQQAARRDFEDAVIHVTHAFDELLAAHEGLDDEGRARLRAQGPVPDVASFLRSHRWLPREVHQIGTMHFRDDQETFEQELFELDAELLRVEESLLHERALAYR